MYARAGVDHVDLPVVHCGGNAMPPITVLDDAYVSLWYHPDTKIIHHRMKQFLAPGVFQKLLTAGAELMEEHKATKWLSDDRDNAVAVPEDLVWAEQVWHPRAARAGFKYWAIVVPAAMVAALQMRTLQARRRKEGIEVETFETVEKAMAWLESRP
jgi:hypothetical protein